ncbi:MAG: flagellar biosynthetic protein FliR [Treponema sp.]|jgi:flagellar biosynthesis protein FliR|nr:flagellar biosynthetic protein FliR [Treponema sp.]
MIDKILLQAPLFVLIFARCFAMLMTLPLFSMRSASRVAKIALAGYLSFFIFSQNGYYNYEGYITEDQIFSLQYVLLLVGEVLIGVIIGFYITIIFSSFSTAGQFIAFQMGLSAASSYDALSQVENPLLGQFFNLIAMLIFMQNQWFQKLFLGGLTASFKTLNAINLVQHQNNLVEFLLSGLTKLFSDALIIALPVVGTLLLISVCTGLLSKAAPQMNLLSEGFPIMILVAFFILMVVFPNIVDFFLRSFSQAFSELERLFLGISGERI